MTPRVTKFTRGFNGPVPTLVFSFVGFDTKEVAVNGQSTIDMTLSEGNALNEVVVVGYGTQKKGDLTGAVGGIRGDAVGISSKAITTMAAP